MDIFILGTNAPATPLASDWALYIIGGMAIAVIVLAGFVATLFFTAKKGIIIGWNDTKQMHNQAIAEIKCIKAGQMENKVELEIIKNDVKEQKYAIQNLSQNIQCKKKN